jgi:hypothetical protein
MNPDRYTSRIPLPPRNDLRQLPDGETGLTSIYFTRDGEAFIMLDSPAIDSSPNKVACAEKG